MNEKSSLSRRNFIKAAGIAGSAALIAGAVTMGESGETAAAPPNRQAALDPLLE